MADFRPVSPARLGLGFGGMRPGEPGYAEKIPPPEPDGFPMPQLVIPPTLTQAAALAITQAPGAKRMVITYGPADQHYMVGIEVAPDWDLEGVPMDFLAGHVHSMVWLATHLGIKVKDLTGRFSHVRSQHETNNVGNPPYPGTGEEGVGGAGPAWDEETV